MGDRINKKKMGNLLIRKKNRKKKKKYIRQVAREETLVPSLTFENKGLKIDPLNGQREDKSLPLFLVIKGKAKGFFLPLRFGHLTRKTRKKRSEGEERKKGKRREEKGRKRKKAQGFPSQGT